MNTKTMHSRNHLFTVLIIASFLFSERLSAQPVILEELIHAALVNNPLLKSAANEISLSGKEAAIARSQRFADIFLESNAGFTNELKTESDYKYLNARLTAEQLLWQNGKVQAVIRQSRYNALIADNSYNMFRQDLILGVKTAYYNCQQQDALYRLAKDNTQRAVLLVEYASERQKLGAGKRTDVLKAESDRSEAIFEEEMYYNAFRNSVNNLAALTGILPDDNWKPDSLIGEAIAMSSYESADSLFRMAVIRYPELQAALNRESAQKEMVKASGALLFPSLSLSTGYSWSDDPTFGNQNNWSALLTIRWNLFNGKENHYRVQCEQIKTEQLSNLTEVTRLNMIRDISNWLISLDEARQQINLFRSMKITTRESLEAAQAQYISGTCSMLELTDARITDLMANKSLIQAITKYRLSRANLERLTGITNKNEQYE